MPFVPHTPESLISRSDSKNPATTCKGITANGRPCRRALASSKTQSSIGVLAVHSIDGVDTSNAAAFFCWQHKDQAEQLAQQPVLGTVHEETRILPLQERTSIDTLVARLGVLEVEEQHAREKRSRHESRENSRRDSSGENGHDRWQGRRPLTWDTIPGPLLSVKQDIVEEKEHRRRRRSHGASEKRPRQSFWGSLCGGDSVGEDYVEVVRHRKRVEGHARVGPTSPAPSRTLDSRAHSRADVTMSPPPINHEQYPRRESGHRRSSQQELPTDRRPLGEKSARPVNTKRPSQTTNLLSFIPEHLSPKTTSLLLTELSKPVSQHDEPGYIYIFWLTSTTSTFTPSGIDAASLLAPQDLSPSPKRPSARTTRRASDVLNAYSDSISSGNDYNASSRSPKTILLKIGRASNVQRRMNEWTRQCGHALSLVRFYPYVPSTPSPSPSPRHSPATSRRPLAVNARSSSSGNAPIAGETVRKVPHAHRVERLVHVELAEKRVVRTCGSCGKEHREWFEVEASRGGVRAVDEVIRRWIGWAEAVQE